MDVGEKLWGMIGDEIGTFDNGNENCVCVCLVSRAKHKRRRQREAFLFSVLTCAAWAHGIQCANPLEHCEYVAVASLFSLSFFLAFLPFYEKETKFYCNLLNGVTKKKD